jgi:quercetin dioxygenase-like cupin family protein
LPVWTCAAPLRRSGAGVAAGRLHPGINRCYHPVTAGSGMLETTPTVGRFPAWPYPMSRPLPSGGRCWRQRVRKLVLAEWVAQARVGKQPRSATPLHAHEEDEAWYVLEGTLRVRVGDDQVEVPARGAVIVPAGTAHTFGTPARSPRAMCWSWGQDLRPDPGPPCQRRPGPGSHPTAARAARRQARRVGPDSRT